MSYLRVSIFLASFTLFSWVAFAVDVPEDDEGANALSNMQCVDEATQTCINDACLTSENIDCQANCAKMARDKCQQENN